MRNHTVIHYSESAILSTIETNFLPWIMMTCVPVNLAVIRNRGMTTKFRWMMKLASKSQSTILEGRASGARQCQIYPGLS